MFVLGLQGSPRLNGNTSALLRAYMEEAESLGADVYILNVYSKNITPCKELKICESQGFCPIDDDMPNQIYSLFWQADVIVLATPVFFYSVPAQLKALIDRSQNQWARKYKLKLEDPGRRWRSGIVLALGATKGANLFEGLNLTAKYFFDAIGADYKGSLTYRRIEDIGDIERQPNALNDARENARTFVSPYLNRKKVLFVCRGNACRSQMSQAFTAHYAGNKIEALSGGNNPSENVNENMIEAMAEKGIDMAFRKPKSVPDINGNYSPDVVVTMGCEVACPVFPGAKIVQWDLPDPAGKSIEYMRGLRDIIEEKVVNLIKDLF